MSDLSAIPISWDPPPPRPGLAGQWDRFIGPGATKSELRLILLSAAGGVVFAAAYALRMGVEWPVWQWALTLLIALDLFGGVVANATSTTKRWYYRSGEGFRQHMVFVAYHFYPFLVAWQYRDGDWLYATAIYGYLLLAAVLILRSAPYLKRPLAAALYLLGLAILSLLFEPTAGLIWFVPVLYLKLLVNHLVPEAPFRPQPAAE